jgi:hypothetical protein
MYTVAFARAISQHLNQQQQQQQQQTTASNIAEAVSSVTSSEVAASRGQWMALIAQLQSD